MKGFYSAIHIQPQNLVEEKWEIVTRSQLCAQSLWGQTIVPKEDTAAVSVILSVRLQSNWDGDTSQLETSGEKTSATRDAQLEAEASVRELEEELKLEKEERWPWLGSHKVPKQSDQLEALAHRFAKQESASCCRIRSESLWQRLIGRLRGGILGKAWRGRDCLLTSKLDPGSGKLLTLSPGLGMCFLPTLPALGAVPRT